MPHEHFYTHDHTGGQSPVFSNPVLYYGGFVHSEPDWYFPPHAHSFLEIIYICDGQGQFIINGREYAAKKGNLLIYNKGALHEERSDPSAPLRTYFCGVGNLSLPGLEPDHLVAEEISPVLDTSRYSGAVEALIVQLVDECSEKAWGYDTVCSNILSSLIILIQRMVSHAYPQDPSGCQYSKISRVVKDYIEDNYTKALTLSDLARSFYISKDYLSHIFKNDIGISPINYLLRLKIEEAKRLIVSTDMTVGEISEAVGYQDPNYLSQMFKKLTGYTPSQFRRMREK